MRRKASCDGYAMMRPLPFISFTGIEGETMTVHQKILRILTLVLIVIAGVELAAGLLFGAGGLLLTSDGVDSIVSIDADLTLMDGDEIVTEASTPAALGIIAIGLAVVFLVDGAFNLIVGILGFRGSKRPGRLRAFIVLNSIVLAFSIVNAIYTAVTNDALGVESAVSMLIPAFVESLSLYCAITVHRAWKSGTLEERVKPDGKPPLGFIAVFQVIFAVNILASLGLCTFLISGRYELSPADILSFATLVFHGVAFWLIWQRSKAARFWICGFAVFDIVVGTIISIAMGTIGVTERLTSCWFDIVVFLYFFFARKPREVLVNEFTIERQKELVARAWDLWKPTTWNFWRSMIIYFCLFSIVGHWMEAGFCTLIKWGLVAGTYDPTSGIWRDYLSPFPIYGIGMVACALLLFPIKTKLQEALHGRISPLVLSFLINTAVCATLELILGFTQNMPDANGIYPLWDYSDMPFNFMGQICLQNTLAFGAVATLVTWVVFPVLQRQYLKLPEDMRKAIFVAVVVFYALVLCLYVVNFPA